jgi:hypothetical protein
MEEEMDLVLETRTEENGTPVIKADGMEIAFTPPIGEDYWSYRVRLSDKQAVVGFPKFSTIGIGFAVEKADWNTNLPYHVPVEKLFQHIKANKGSRKIKDADVRRAIEMIQAAAMADRNNERRAMVKWDVAPQPNDNARMLDEALRAMNKAVLEHDTLTGYVAELRADADALRQDLQRARTSRDEVIAKLEQAEIDRDERLTLRESSDLAKMVDEAREESSRLRAEVDRLERLTGGTSRLSAAGVLALTADVPAPDPADDGPLVTISGTDLVPWDGETTAADPVPVAPPVLSDGGQVFMSPLLRLGRPTKDGRTLASMGAYSIADARHGVPLQRRVDDTSKLHVTDLVGRIMGVVRDGDDILAIGVAEPDVAAALNTGALCLAADLEADPVSGEHGGVEFAGARVRGARVRDGGTFAWE